MALDFTISLRCCITCTSSRRCLALQNRDKTVRFWVAGCWLCHLHNNTAQGAHLQGCCGQSLQATRHSQAAHPGDPSPYYNLHWEVQELLVLKILASVKEE